jgi:hypothetical protein
MSAGDEGGEAQDEAEDANTDNIRSRYGWLTAWWFWLLGRPERLTALSTFAIFLATAVAVAVGIAQWRVIKGQLVEMQEASHIAAGQLQVAQGQLTKIMSDERPAIYIDIPYDISIYSWAHASEGASFINLPYRLTNYGKRPAVITKSDCSPEIIDQVPSGSFLENRLITFGAAEDNPNADPIIITSGDTKTFKCGQFFHRNSKEHTNALNRDGIFRTELANSGKLWVIAFVDYEDLMGTPHRVAVCKKVRPAGAGFTREGGEGCNKGN